jgi:hypothetical protein
MTFQATRNAISSREAVSGPSQLDLLDGLTTARYGPDRAPANRSRPPAKGSEPMIQGICGRTFIASSVPDGPLSSWESRLRERLAAVGSTESALIWKETVSPQGRSISRLAVSTRHTNGTACTGSLYPTPTTSRGGDNSNSAAVKDRGHGNNLQGVMTHVQRAVEAGGWDLSSQEGCPPSAPTAPPCAAHWITASARDWKDTPGMATEAGERNRVDQLPRQMAQSPQAFHPTPLSLSFKDSHQPGTNRTIEQMRAYMPTPTVADVQGGRKARSGARSNEPLLNGLCFEMEATGPMPTGSTATTAKRGAPNPVFAFWLMGFPDEWISGALEAMRSYRKPRRK